MKCRVGDRPMQSVDECGGRERFDILKPKGFGICFEEWQIKDRLKKGLNAVSVEGKTHKDSVIL